MHPAMEIPVPQKTQFQVIMLQNRCDAVYVESNIEQWNLKQLLETFSKDYLLKLAE